MQQRTAILIIVILIIAIGGGLGGWYYLSTLSQPVVDTGTTSTTNPNLFPFGTNPTTAKPPTQVTTSTSTNNGSVPIVRQISNEPVAGFTIIEKKGLPVTVRYMERATGHIFDAPLNTITVERVTNTTIPRVQEALFANNGDTIIARYGDEASDTIITYSGKINRATSTVGGTITGSFLPENISALDVHPLGTKIFYLTPNGNGASGFISNPDGTKPTKIFSSVLREWIPSWINDTNILLTTKASSQASGAILALNTKTGETPKLVSGNALTSIGGNTEVLYAQGVNVFAFDTKTKKTSTIPVNTLSEKCTISNAKVPIAYCGVPDSIPSGVYPDTWYQGITHFNDSLWKFNTVTNETTQISTLQSAGGIDIVSPKVSANEEYVVFINKTNNTLWSVNLKTQP